MTPQKARHRAIALAFAAALGGFPFGFDSSVVNVAVDAIQGQCTLSHTLTGFAIALLECVIGSWLGCA